MSLTNLKPRVQREALEKIGLGLISISKYWDEESVEILLDHLETGVLDELGPEDFFGTEGWEHFFNLED